jgi:cell filamentation protein
MNTKNNTDYTPGVDDNLLGLTNKQDINIYEASGITKAELLLQELEMDSRFDISLILTLHRIAFGELYEWAGKWRTIDVQVGKLNPPVYTKVPNLMYQYAEEVDFRLSLNDEKEQLASVFAYLHHRFVWIHPFNNGNGRTARLLLDFAALYKGYEPINLYHREGEARMIYIEALRSADVGNYEPLSELILPKLTPF